MANVRDPNKENRGLLTKLVKYKRKQKRLIKSKIKKPSLYHGYFIDCHW